jgi:hypothetical protein
MDAQVWTKLAEDNILSVCAVLPVNPTKSQVYFPVRTTTENEPA